MNRTPAVLFVVSVMMSAGASTSPLAQSGSALPGPSPQIAFKSGVEAVTVTATVRDHRGRIVRHLQRGDFEVIDSGIPREIRDFITGDSPISLAILLDISGSMAVGGNIDRAREAVSMVTSTLRDQVDEAALFTFDSELQEVVKFTRDLPHVRQVGLKGRPWGQTSLYDAIAQSARTLTDRTNNHRAVLVITDGVDTGSRLRAPEVSAIASAIDVPIYLLTVVTPLDHQGGEFAVIEKDGKVAETVTLADLARWTGGGMRIASLPEHTRQAVTDLVEELRHQYLITFEPGERAGWHPLEIRTRKKNLVVHARSGYTAGPSRIS